MGQAGQGKGAQAAREIQTKAGGKTEDGVTAACSQPCTGPHASIYESPEIMLDEVDAGKKPALSQDM